MLRILLSALLVTSLSAASFVCDTDRANNEYMAAWCSSTEAERLKSDYSLASHDGTFASFLNAFATHEDVVKMLASRPQFDYAGKTIQESLPELKEGEGDEFKEERAQRKAVKDEQEALYNAWVESLEAVLTTFSAQVLKDHHHVCPSTVVIRFDAFPQYVVKMRARNGYRLGFYDEEGRYSCAVPATRISEYEFPAQLASHVLYAEKTQAFLAAHSITNVQVPNHYLFVLPGHESAVLDDANLFLVADFVPFKEEYQEGLFKLVCAAYASYKSSEGQVQNDPIHSMLANLFKVIEGCSLWDFYVHAGNFALTFNEAGLPTFVFLRMERPAFGGGNPLYFFHKNDEECASNASVGLSKLAELFTPPAETDGEFSEIALV